MPPVELTVPSIKFIEGLGGVEGAGRGRECRGAAPPRDGGRALRVDSDGIGRVAAHPPEEGRVDQARAIGRQPRDERVCAAIVGRAEGTGLGLSIVHKIIEAHKGRILVDTLPGKGTTFTILLPK